MQLKSCIIAFFSFSTLTLATTVAGVESDISSNTKQAASLDGQITAFPNTGGSLTAALAIHSSLVNLGSSIQKTTTDINSVSPKPVAEADGNTILAAVQGFQSQITITLNDIVAKKTAFNGLPIAGIAALIKQDLTALNANTTAFGTAWVDINPVVLRSQASATSSAVNSAFASAIAAYS